jgi:hypothetical protein
MDAKYEKLRSADLQEGIISFCAIMQTRFIFSYQQQFKVHTKEKYNG